MKNKEISLKEIMDYAIKHNFDTDLILDSWNKSKENTIKAYLAMQLFRDIELDSRKEYFRPGDPSEFRSDKIDIPTPPRQSKRKDDMIIAKNIASSLRNDLRFNEDEDTLIARLVVSSTFSSHIEETELIFSGTTNKEDEGVLNAIDATFSELSYWYIMNM